MVDEGRDESGHLELVDGVLLVEEEEDGLLNLPREDAISRRLLFLRIKTADWNCSRPALNRSPAIVVVLLVN